MRRTLEQFIDPWLAGYADRGLEERFRAELALGFALFQVLVFALFCAVELISGTPAMGYIHLSAQLPLIVSLYLLRRGAALSWVSLILIGNIYLVIIVVIVISAGRAVGAVVALPAFVMVALMLSRRLGGWVWMLLVVLAMLLAAQLHNRVVTPWVQPSPDWLERAAYRVPLLVSLAIAFVAVSIKRALGSYRRALLRAQDEERKQRAGAAAAAERFAAFADLAADGFWETDAELRLEFVSPSFTNSLRVAPEIVLGLPPVALFERLSPTASSVQRLIEPMQRRVEFADVVLQVPRRSGEVVWLKLKGLPRFDRDGEFIGYRGCIHDISAQRAVEQSLRDAENRLRTITDNIPALISYIDADRVFRFNNRTYTQWLRRPLSEITGKALTEVYAPPTYARIKPYLDRAFAGEEVSFELERTRTRERHVRVTYVPDVAPGGGVVGVYGMIHDVSRFKDIERQLRELSQIDGLTQLANRRRYDERLGHALALSDRTGQALALLFLDLDRFKELNDALGHEAGDQALVEFAKRLKRCARESDTVARLGGDEFVVILENVDGPQSAITVAEKILAAMQTPLRLSDQSWPWSTSIGIALRVGPGMDEEALLRAADRSLYAAKAAGRGCYRLAGECSSPDDADAP